MSTSEIAESHEQFREAWSAIARYSPSGEIVDIPGLCLVDSGQPWVFSNAAFLTAPVADAADLERRAEAAIEHFEPTGNQWFFTASTEWLGSDAEDVLTSLGLASALDLTGMVAGELRPPVRPLPDVIVRAIGDETTRTALLDLNAAAYGVPVEWARMAIGHPDFWQQPLYGHVAYVDDVAAAANFVKQVGDALYVGWVATAEAHRRRGLGELVIRRSLDEAAEATRLRRTTLHATEAGRPVYERMGYRSVARFPIWGPAPV